LCNNDDIRPLLIEVLDYKRKGKNAIIGRLETCVKQMISTHELGSDSEVSLNLKMGKKHSRSNKYR